MKVKWRQFFVLLLFLPFFGCPAPSTGSLSGIITDLATSSPLEGVKIIIFDADTNAPTGSTLFTDGNGEYEQEQSRIAGKHPVCQSP